MGTATEGQEEPLRRGNSQPVRAIRPYSLRPAGPCRAMTWNAPHSVQYCPSQIKKKPLGFWPAAERWPSPVVPVLHVRDFGTMEGTQEALSGKMRLLFTPAARTSLLMLRLNEAALRALQECQQQQVRPVIAFQGHRGYLRFPGPGWSCLFSFIVSQCGQEGTNGGLDLVYQRLGRSGPNCLHCLGSLRERLTIWAAMDTIPAPLLAQEHLTEGTRESESWQDTGDEPEGHPQLAPDEVSDPLASHHEQSLPGSSSEPMAQWEMRNHTYLPSREPDQSLLSPASQKRLDKKRSAPITTEEPEEKRLRALPLASSPLQGLANQDSQEGEDWGQDEDEEGDEDGDSRLEQSLSAPSASESPSPEEVPDYLLQYRAIHSTEQQQAYEQDFETDYAEYRILHARVGAASQRFTELGAEIKRLQRGTPEHKVLEDKIVQEYKKFRKRYPSYREEKHRCEYLHQKLSHIKGLILEFEEKNRGS